MPINNRQGIVMMVKVQRLFAKTNLKIQVCRTDKIPLGTKGACILSSRVGCGASFTVSRRKLLTDVSHFVQGGYTPLALMRLSPVDLPSANGFDKPFAASKFEKGQLCTGKHICNLKLTKCISRKIDNDTSFW